MLFFKVMWIRNLVKSNSYKNEVGLDYLVAEILFKSDLYTFDLVFCGLKL